MSESKFFLVRPDGGLQSISTAAGLLDAVKGGGYAWLDFFDPTREDLAPLVEHFGVHPLSVEDCLDDDQVPKIEDFPGNTFVLFNDCSRRDGALVMEERDFILGKNFLVTVSGHQGGDPDQWRKMQEKAARVPAEIRRGPDFLLHEILDHTVDHKFASIEALQEAIDTAEEEILGDPAAFQPELLMRLRRELLTLRKSIFHEREILVKVCRRDCPFISEKAIYHFRDIYDHLAKYFEAVEINREMITSLMEMYLSMINNRMAETANRTNHTVRRLTVINTIFMPLTLLAGIGGMSEWSMMTGPSHWKMAYPAFLLGMAAIGGINWWLLRWVERRSAER